MVRTPAVRVISGWTMSTSLEPILCLVQLGATGIPTVMWVVLAERVLGPQLARHLPLISTGLRPGLRALQTHWFSPGLQERLLSPQQSLLIMGFDFLQRAIR